MLGQYEMGFEDYLAIFRRRKWLLIVPAVVVPALAFAGSLFLPKKFTSTTLVLVEQQKVPEAFVRSVVTDQLNQRLATMQEQILSRSRLEPILTKFDLYKGEASPMEELVGRIRRAVQVTPIKPVVRGQTDYPGFYISFTGSEPRIVQQICSEIASMFMEENLKDREKRATGTTEFLDKQLEDAKQVLDEQDKRMAIFKQRYVGQLPGTEKMNLDLLTSLSSQLEAVTQALNRAQQDKIYMESLLAQQIASWDASKTGQNPVTLEQQLSQQESAMAALEGRYTPDHPDVIKARGDIAALQKRIEQAKKMGKDPKVADSNSASFSEPPQLQQLRNQIYQAQQTIKEKNQQQERLQRDIKMLQGRVQLSPLVEQQYKELTRDYQTALDSYNDLLQKRTQSAIARDLERRQQGEQFRVIDPPNLPAKPSFPDPMVFTGGGFGGGIALGIVLILALEFRDRAIRNERDIEALLQLPTLALIPIVHEGTTKSGWTFRKKRKPATTEAGVVA